MIFTDTFIYKESEKYALARKLKNSSSKKVTLNSLKNEILGARIIGELSGAERILKAIIDNPDFTREDIEAEIHVFIKETNNIVCELFQASKLVQIDDILKIYGYIDKEKTQC